MKKNGTRKTNLVVIYRWNKNDGGLTPEVLGESIAGFGSAIRDVLGVTRINKPVSIHVEVAEEGSIELGYVLDVISQNIFANWSDLYDFLSFLGKTDLLGKAKDFAKAHDDINAFFAKYPLDMALLGLAAKKMFDLAKRQKRSPDVSSENGRPVPKRYAVGLHKLVRKGAYKKAMKPFVENQVNEVELRSGEHDTSPTKITTTDFSQYLGEKEQVLPEYENGKSYRFAAQLVGLEQSMGEHLKFKMSQLPRPHNLLVSYPEDEKATTDYTEYYGKQVFIHADVIRQSMYHKPKLKLQSIELAQEPLV